MNLISTFAIAVSVFCNSDRPSPHMFAVAFDGGDRIVAVGQQSTVIRKSIGSDITTQAPLAGVPPRDLFLCGILDPAGTSFVMSHDGIGARLNWSDGSSVVAPIQVPPKDEFTALAINRMQGFPATYIAFGTKKGSIQIAKIGPTSMTVKHKVSVTGQVWTMGYSPCGDRLAASDEKGLRIWQIGDEDVPIEPVIIPLETRVCRLVWVSNKLLYVGGFDGTVLRITDPCGDFKITKVAQHSASLLAMAATQKEVAVGFQDGSVTVIETAEKGMVATLSTGTEPITALAFDKEGQKLLTLSLGGSMRIRPVSEFRTNGVSGGNSK